MSIEKEKRRKRVEKWNIWATRKIRKQLSTYIHDHEKKQEIISKGLNKVEVHRMTIDTNTIGESLEFLDNFNIPQRLIMGHMGVEILGFWLKTYL